MFLATLGYAVTGKYAITECFVCQTARQAYQTGRRVARLGQASSTVFQIHRVVDRTSAPRYGEYHAEWLATDMVRR